MRVFITGATGYVGGAVASALRRQGHEVAALVRPESDSRKLRDEGIFIIAGDLASLPSLSDTVAQYDVLVHAAFSSTDSVAQDKTVLDVFTSTKAFIVYTSGVWVLGNGTADETSKTNPLSLVAWRPAHEQRVLATGRGAVVRPGCVYGGKQSLLASWFAAAEGGQPISIVGDGNNHWALVHLNDVADCYARAVNKRATGIYHAVDDTNASLNECATGLAPKVTIEHAPADAARQKMGPFVDALVADQRVSSQRTRQALGWKPMHTFLSSMDEQWREWRATRDSAR